MDQSKQLLDSCITWFTGEDNIRCVILIGSRAQSDETDRMAGIDLDLFVRDPEALIEQAGWLGGLEEPLLTHIDYEGDLIIWRGIFEDGLLLALFIQPLTTLSAIQEDLPPYYLPQYKVLIDKDDQTALFPKPAQDLEAPSQPTPDAFSACLTRFWLKVYFTMKCIWREDLWRAKHYDWQAKQELLQMLGWYATVCEGQKGFTTIEGDQIITWVNSSTYAALENTFGHFDRADSWRALKETIRLFTQLAKAIAAELNFEYPRELETKFNLLMNRLVAEVEN
jgi:aminoglycoside 6-adenylyltransferase